MKKMMKTAVLVLVAAVASAAEAFELEPIGSRNRKLILCGWEFGYLTPEDYLASAEDLDKTPADGVVVYIQKNPAVGRNFTASEIMMEPLWTDEHLSDLVAPMTEMAKHRSMRHSFIKSFRAPKDRRLDWRDEKAWAVVANNVAAVARLAKKVGFPGIQMDIEDYSKKRQFWRVESDPPLNELKKHVRARGRQVGKAIFDAYPEITVFSYFGLSELFFGQDERNVIELARAKRDLLPAFLNGLLDVMPPKARFQEGTENAYKYDYAKRDFLTAKTRNSNWYLPLIEPENRVKYLTQVITGFGIYLDMYVNNDTATWYFPPVDGSRLEYLRRNVSQALSGTDEYVWIWGERGRWIDWKVVKPMNLHGGAKKGRWSDLIPGGLFESLHILKNPEKHLLPKIEKAIALVNKGAKLIGTNPDTIGPTEHGIMPATGSLVAPIEIATGKKAYFVGKPNPLMLRHGLRKLGCHSEEIAFIGDRMDTDIIAGIESNVDSVLVLSGVTAREDIDRFPYRPTYILNGVGDIVKQQNG